uniref:Uncharacterized protein n=1 Tax=Anguilla anguilla TaxID=7936 RepID=A0A0E9TNJ8_ANGAN
MTEQAKMMIDCDSCWNRSRIVWICGLPMPALSFSPR